MPTQGSHTISALPKLMEPVNKPGKTAPACQSSPTRIGEPPSPVRPKCVSNSLAHHPLAQPPRLLDAGYFRPYEIVEFTEQRAVRNECAAWNWGGGEMVRCLGAATVAVSLEDRNFGALNFGRLDMGTE